MLTSGIGTGPARAAPPLGSVVRGAPPAPAGPPSLSPQRHHFAQAIAILNTHGCNIFDHFSRKVMGSGVGVGQWDLGAGLRWEKERGAQPWGLLSLGEGAGRLARGPDTAHTRCPRPRTISACWT